MFRMLDSWQEFLNWLFSQSNRDIKNRFEERFYRLHAGGDTVQVLMDAQENKRIQ